MLIELPDLIENFNRFNQAKAKKKISELEDRVF